MSSLVSFTAPMSAGLSVTSGPLQVSRALNITGTVFSDQAGHCYVDQGGDGIDWDYTTTITVPAATGTQINVPVLDQWCQIRYINGGSNQTIFRLYADLRDPYGAFLQNSLPPSAGGAFAVLQWQDASGTYSYVGRFDGLDAWNAITNAALFTGQNGRYAAFVVAGAIVSDETINRSTNHAPDTF